MITGVENELALRLPKPSLHDAHTRASTARDVQIAALYKINAHTLLLLIFEYGILNSNLLQPAPNA